MRKMAVFTGTVLRGKARGASLGYPTANIRLGNENEIDEGIFISETRILENTEKGGKQVWRPSVTFIGRAVTFGETVPSIETYILDWKGDLYGKKIEVKLKMKIRDNEKFDSVDALVVQIGKDVQKGREYFEEHGGYKDPLKYTYKPYDPVYTKLFDNEKKRIQKILPTGSRIEHIGSTAVPGLGGKGIIDIYLLGDQNEEDRSAQQITKKLGYSFRPAGSDDKKLFFRRFQTDKNSTLRTYHIHLSRDNGEDMHRCIVLRDYLRTHPSARRKYDSIKKEGSKKAMTATGYEMQKKIYQKHKLAFLNKLIRKALA